jgi:hypothetical protein
MLEHQSFSCATETGECSLSPEDFRQRVEQWTVLASETLTRTLEEGKVLSTYPRTDQIRQRLRDLIAAEAVCCPFLIFEMKELPDIIEVELRYPPEFEAVVALVVPELNV